MQGAAQQGGLIGATIGNYQVISKLGEGGMGEVYLAEHPLIGKKVALKVLHAEYSANQDVVTRFFNEAKAVNDIGHPNIVDIIDYGVVQPQHGAQFVYFIMEYLNGESLAAVCQRDAPLPPERALRVASQIADALAASHAKGIIHRDLKPDNIYLGTRGRETDFVKVLDFGIAKLTGDAPGSRKTRTGIVMGTPAYMSPEQCEGKGNIDHRTDIYALGILLYEMITGRVPFLGEGYGEVLVQHLTKRPERPSTVRGAIPPHVEAVVMKALEKKREDRFQTMEQFIAAMRDPQAYVEESGGLAAFGPDLAAAQLPVGTGGPMPAGASVTPYPAMQLGAAAPPRPTTLGDSAGEVLATPGGRSRMPVIAISAVLALAVLGGGGYFLFGRGDGDKDKGKDVQAAAAAGKTTDPKVPPEKQPDVVKPDVGKPEVVKPDAKTVVISVSSTPSGAEIFVGAETTARGKTPMDLSLARDAADTQLTLKLPGYKDKQKSVKTDRDSNLDFELLEDPKVVVKDPGVKDPARSTRRHRDRDAKKKDPKKTDKDGVLSPF